MTHDLKNQDFKKCMLIGHIIEWLIKNLIQALQVHLGLEARIQKLLSDLHAVSSYKKRLYKKRLVDFMRHKKRQLVDIGTAKKPVSKPN